METNENSNRNLKDEHAVEKDLRKTAKNAGIKRGAFISGLIGIIILIAALITGYSVFKHESHKQQAQMELQKNNFNTELTTRDSVINDWFLTFDQIEKDLNLIKQKENMLTLKSPGAELSKDKRQQVLADIKDINTLLDNNRKKIAELSARIKSSNGTMKELQAKIDDLDATMKQYESNIADLKTGMEKKDVEISQLNSKVAGMDVTIAQKDTTIKDQTARLNQGYLVSGTFKQLKEKGIVAGVGGFLGIGRKGVLVPDLSDTLFSKVDISQLKTIPVHSKDAKLITKHPTGSYELVPGEDNQIAYIEIKDPDSFWKISKYAVVELKK